MLYRFRTWAHVFIHIYTLQQQRMERKKKYNSHLHFSFWFIFHPFFLLSLVARILRYYERPSAHIKLHDFILPLFLHFFFFSFFILNTFLFTFPLHFLFVSLFFFKIQQIYIIFILPPFFGSLCVPFYIFFQLILYVNVLRSF